MPTKKETRAAKALRNKIGMIVWRNRNTPAQKTQAELLTLLGVERSTQQIYNLRSDLRLAKARKATASKKLQAMREKHSGGETAKVTRREVVPMGKGVQLNPIAILLHQRALVVRAIQALKEVF